MERYPADERIAIGDSVTDLQMGQEAEVVFARDRLQKYLNDRGVAYRGWTDFHDIRQQLKALWGNDE
jgi:2-hydroxy-3-keto-5-methylthiopentenyl-1-phosphate phosphatase